MHQRGRGHRLAGVDVLPHQRGQDAAGAIGEGRGGISSLVAVDMLTSVAGERRARGASRRPAMMSLTVRASRPPSAAGLASRRASNSSRDIAAGQRAFGTRTSPSTIAVRRRWVAPRRPACCTDSRPARGAAAAAHHDESATEARAHAGQSRPEAESRRAPSRVAMARTSRAGSAPGPRRTACRVAASRISWNMSRWLLHAAPSAPSETETPRAAQLDHRRDARPELQVRARAVEHLHLALGQQIACSRSSTQTQWARHRCGDRPARPRPGSRCWRDRSARRTSATSSRFSDAWRVHQQPVLPGQAARPPRADRASTTPRSAARGPRAAGRWPAPFQRAGQRQALVDRRLRRARAAGRHRRGRRPSCTCRRRRAGPVGSSASNTASVSCTVSIVRTAGRAAQQQLRRGERGGGARATLACAPPPAARSACAASRAAAGRRHSRGTASGTDGRASGRSRAGR